MGRWLLLGRHFVSQFPGGEGVSSCHVGNHQDQETEGAIGKHGRNLYYGSYRKK